MGLDVALGFILDEDMGLIELLDEVLAQHGMEMTHRFDEEGLGRGYGLRDFAEFCRAERLPYPHICKLTCSCWQMVVPMDFPDPIPMFADKQPEDYKDLWIPDQYGLSKEALKKYDEESDREMMERLGLAQMIRCSGRYHYYMTTPASGVYLLAAPQLLKEAIGFLDKYVPEWREEGFDIYDESHHDQAWNAAFLFQCCRECIKNKQVLWFSG